MQIEKFLFIFQFRIFRAVFIFTHSRKVPVTGSPESSAAGQTRILPFLLKGAIRSFFDKVRSLLVSFSITVQLVTRIIAMDIVDQNHVVPDANEASRIDFMLHLHHQYRTLQQILLAPPHLPLTDMEQDRMSFPFQRADFIKIHAVNAFNILRFSVRGPNQGKLSGPSLPFVFSRIHFQDRTWCCRNTPRLVSYGGPCTKCCTTPCSQVTPCQWESLMKT